MPTQADHLSPAGPKPFTRVHLQGRQGDLTVTLLPTAGLGPRLRYLSRTYTLIEREGEIAIYGEDMEGCAECGAQVGPTRDAEANTGLRGHDGVRAGEGGGEAGVGMKEGEIAVAEPDSSCPICNGSWARNTATAGLSSKTGVSIFIDTSDFKVVQAKCGHEFRVGTVKVLGP